MWLQLRCGSPPILKPIAEPVATDGQGAGDRSIASARERMAEVLRAALEPNEDAPIDDETRRLMLHLSIESPPEPRAYPVAVPAPEPVAAPPSLLRRVFSKKARQHDAVHPGASKRGPGRG